MKIKELAVPRTMAKLTECLWQIGVAVLAFSCGEQYLKVAWVKYSTLS